MGQKIYKCTNGCEIRVKKFLLKDDKGKYSWGFPQITYCPKCGSIMQNTLKKIKCFLELSLIHEKLEKAVNLLYKSEYEASIRESIVVLENYLRKKSGLDLHGTNLVAQSLGFEYDKAKRIMKREPKIKINSLDSESELNEQEGLKLMLMGFFQGSRNMYQHNNIYVPVNVILTLLLQISFFLKLIDGGSLTKHAYVIKKKVDVTNILNNMPKKSDRKNFKKYLKSIQKNNSRVN